MSILPGLLKGFVQPSFWAGEGFENWSGPQWTGHTIDREAIERDFEGYVFGAMKVNGIVFACTVARMMAFSQGRFGWRKDEAGTGRPMDLFYDGALDLIRDPWKGGTTGDLLARMEQDGTLAGNAYFAKTTDGKRLRRLQPDWVSILTGSPTNDPYDVDAEVLGYIYKPKRGPDKEELLLSPSRIVHYAPIPDPVAQWRGMSWLTPVIDEIQADRATTRHKLKFFQNGAVPGLMLSYDPKLTPKDFQIAVSKFAESHEGLDKAYKTLHVGGGADPKVVGANMQQMDFKVTQGAGENRIAVAARVPAVILGISEGLAGSSLNAGNYSASRRSFADLTISPLWNIAASSLQQVLTAPDGAYLAADTRDVPFLREDAKQQAETDQIQGSTIRSLIDAGFIPASVIAAIRAGDWSLLQHSGLYSVQLQKPQSITVTEIP